MSDSAYVCETLYRKQNCEYFLHMEGNAGSRHARIRAGGGSTWGERIEPLSYEDAQTWAQEHEGFGHERVLLLVGYATRERVRREAARAGISLGIAADRMIARAAQD